MNDLKLELVVVRQASLGFFEWETTFCGVLVEFLWEP